MARLLAPECGLGRPAAALAGRRAVRRKGGRPTPRRPTLAPNRYTIVPRATAHLYDERFVGYGKDRVSWNYELAAKGAAFLVLPDVFLIHFNTYDEDEVRSPP